MAAAYPVSYKLQTFSCNCLLNNNKNHKSYKIPTKSVSFGNFQPESHLCNFPCSSSSSSSSRFSVNALDLKDVYASVNELINNYSTYAEVLSVTILLLDEDGKHKQKLDKLVGNKIDEIDAKKESEITLKEVVPLLLENASVWMNSRLMVSLNLKEAFLKLFKSEQVMTDKITPQNDEQEALVAANPFNATRCTEVYMDICIKDVLDNKFKEIYTRDDLIGLLHHLTSTEAVKERIYAMPTCIGFEGEGQRVGNILSCYHLNLDLTSLMNNN
ncbi:uncharacterized protein LOC141594446 [Silene latifolia]|uniref:uncharacterized protein LOC141594446 n=1 Tax=Silene latifolia TaxID=37657 RepID=UPI003D7883A9